MTESKTELKPELVECFEQQRQVISYGAPGTGKSYSINEYLKEKDIKDENQFRTIFHPDSDYSTFVGAYKPTMDGNEIKYKFVPQVFLKAYVHAYQKPEEEVYLVIEEINRGNCAQIFGDIFQLLDRNDEGRSEYPIKADDEIQKYLEEVLGKDHEGIKDGKLSLPSNLYIYATMNTSDQSLFPIDSAFKRRWYWVYSPIKYGNKDWVIKINDNHTYSWTSFQKVVNDKILAATNSEDKMLGDYFVKPNGNEISKVMFRDKILFYLWNDVCKDGSGDIFVGKDKKAITFSSLYDKDGDNKLIAIIEHLKTDENWAITDNEGQNSDSPKDRTRYYIGNEDDKTYSKSQLPTELVKLYIKKNDNLSDGEIIDNLKELFKGLGPHSIETPDEWEDRTDNNKASLSNFIDKNGNKLPEKSSDTFICVANNIWNKDNIPNLIEKVNWTSVTETKQS